MRALSLEKLTLPWAKPIAGEQTSASVRSLVIMMGMVCSYGFIGRCVGYSYKSNIVFVKELKREAGSFQPSTRAGREKVKDEGGMQKDECRRSRLEWWRGFMERFAGAVEG